MTTISTRGFGFGLCLGLGLALGCGSGSRDDVAVETGETGDGDGDPEAGDPLVSDTPLVAGALWSLEWAVDAVPQLDSGPLGLALATTERCVLIDGDTGAVVWSLAAPLLAEATVVRIVGDQLVWGLRTRDGWTLMHFDGAMADQGVVSIGTFEALAIDQNGLFYAQSFGELAAFGPGGSPSWTHALSSGYSLVVLDGLDGPDGGVVALEISDAIDNGEAAFRLQRFDAAGEAVFAVDFSAALAVTDDVAVVGDQVYVSAGGVLGLSGVVFAVDVGTASHLTTQFGVDEPVTVEPGVQGGAYVVAEGGPDQPATLLTLDTDGATKELAPVCSHQGSDRVLLEVGGAGEVFAGGHADGVLELNRVQ